MGKKGREASYPADWSEKNIKKIQNAVGEQFKDALDAEKKWKEGGKTIKLFVEGKNKKPLSWQDGQQQIKKGKRTPLVDKEKEIKYYEEQVRKAA